MRRLIVLILTVGILCTLFGFNTQAALSDLAYDSFTASDLTELPYRIHVPDVPPPEDGYSVFIHLHGIGECGYDNEAQLSVGMELVQPLLARHKNDTIVIVPQSMEPWVNVAPAAGTYSVDAVAPSPYLTAVMELLQNKIQKEYVVNANRLYVAGLSMGGYGVWDLLARYPHTFAAAIPVCGGGDPTKAHLMSDVAIRTYHSADDPIVPVTGTRAMVDAVKAAGGNIAYTEYTNLSHGCWSKAFNAPDQLLWLYKQERSAAQPTPPPVVPDYTLGDVDENGVVAAADALEVLKNVVGKVTLTQAQRLAADTDKNGVVAAADGLMILQVVVGKLPPFNQ